MRTTSNARTVSVSCTRSVWSQNVKGHQMVRRFRRHVIRIFILVGFAYFGKICNQNHIKSEWHILKHFIKRRYYVEFNVRWTFYLHPVWLPQIWLLRRSKSFSKFLMVWVFLFLSSYSLWPYRIPRNGPRWWSTTLLAVASSRATALSLSTPVRSGAWSLALTRSPPLMSIFNHLHQPLPITKTLNLK